MADGKRIYWDACAWIGLINEEPAKVRGLSEVYGLAQKGDIELWTSVLNFAEVYKSKNENENPKPWAEAEFNKIAAVLSQPFIKLTNIDYMIGQLARQYLRTLPGLKKPNDALHLATAAWHNLDEFHTYDKDDILNQNSKIKRRDGIDLIICVPQPKPIGPLFR